MNKPRVSVDQLRHVWQNRQRGTGAVSLGTLVRSLVRTEGLDSPGPLASMQGIWDEQVGLELSRHSRLEGLRRGTLRVEVDSAAHMVELKGLVQAGLAKQLSEGFEDSVVKTIRLRLGSQRPIGGSDKRRKSH